MNQRIPDHNPLSDEADGDEDEGGPLNKLRRKLIRWFAILSVMCFVVGVVASAVNGNVNNTTIEGISLFVLRTSLSFALLGLVGLMIAFRMPRIEATLASNSRDGKKRRSLFVRLLIWNGILFIATSVIVVTFSFLAPMVLVIATTFMTPILLGCLTNGAIVYKGVIRAYLIGFLVSLLFMLFSLSTAIEIIRFNLRYLSPDSFGYFMYNLSGMNLETFSLVFCYESSLFLSVTSGLVSAAFVQTATRMEAGAVKTQDGDK